MNNDLPICPIHNKPMKERVNRRGETWKDHRAKGVIENSKFRLDEGGLWHICRGSGWKMALFQ